MKELRIVNIHQSNSSKKTHGKKISRKVRARTYKSAMRVKIKMLCLFHLDLNFH